MIRIFMKIKTIVLVGIIISLVGVAAFTACKSCDHSDSAAAEAEIYYTCPMHPSVISDSPGSCPVCGMRLVKKERVIEEDHSAHGDVDKKIVEVSISPTKQVLANVATTEVKERDLVEEINTVGFSAYDKDLYVAQQAYLSARKTGSSSVIKAAKNRLQILGISDDEISNIRSSGHPDKALFGMNSDTIVWVYADLYESDMKWVHVNSDVTIIAAAYPEEVFSGNVVSLVPVVGKTTRTLKARIRIVDPGRKLKPQMFSLAVLKIDAGKHLAIPSSSVIDTGLKKRVWVERSPGKYFSKNVHLGNRVGDYFIVLEGLEAGERVVSEGGFLIDSEAELKSFGSGGEHQH
jgi:Cu(I)/Ag(I) efflux system membrane fusion protein